MSDAKLSKGLGTTRRRTRHPHDDNPMGLSGLPGKDTRLSHVGEVACLHAIIFKTKTR